MDATNNNDTLAESLLREIRKTTPTACLGFPPPDELQRLRNSCQAAHILRMERLETEREARLQKLKQAALANLRKGRP
jgi:hypothetical protein